MHMVAQSQLQAHHQVRQYQLWVQALSWQGELASIVPTSRFITDAILPMQK